MAGVATRRKKERGRPGNSCGGARVNMGRDVEGRAREWGSSGRQGMHPLTKGCGEHLSWNTLGEEEKARGQRGFGTDLWAWSQGKQEEIAEMAVGF